MEEKIQRFIDEGEDEREIVRKVWQGQQKFTLFDKRVLGEKTQMRRKTVGLLEQRPIALLED